MNLYVGNLSSELTEDELRVAFEAFGPITSCKIIKDKFTGESRGFGFVEMAEQEHAKSAMQDLNGTELKGKKITVTEARERSDSRRGGSGRSGGAYNRY